MISEWHGLDGNAPAKRIEELVPLLRRLWRLHEAPVDHEGRFYRGRIRALAEMAPAWEGDIPVYTAGVNPRMIEAAGRVADGLLGHTLFTPRYLREVAMPALERGARHAGRDPGELSIVTLVLASAHPDEARARREAAAMISFYGSVRTYGPLFEACGFGDAAREIQAAFAARDSDGMVAAVSDAMVDEFAVAGTPAQVNERLARFDGLVDEIVLFPPSFRVGPERVAENLAMLTAQCAPDHRVR